MKADPVIEPTPQEIELANSRREVADERNGWVVEATTAMGEGANAYGQWVEVDKSGVLPNRVTPCADWGEGWRPIAPNDLERLEDGRFRWSVHFNFLGRPGETYRPKSAQQLAAARVRREWKATAKAANEMPLFSEQILEGQLDPKDLAQLK